MSLEPDNHRHDDHDSSQLLAVLSTLVRAESADQWVEAVVRGLGDLTSAGILYFERDTDGRYRLVHFRDRVGIALCNRDISEPGNALAQHLPEVLETGQPGIDRPATTLFTYNLTSEGFELPVRPPGPFARLFTSDVAAVAPLHFGGQQLGAIVGLWHVSTPALMHAREAVTMAEVCDIAAPALHRIRKVERLRHRLAESETIRRLTDSVARTSSFVGALDTICRSAQLITGLDLVATAATTSDQVIWKAACGASDPSFLGTRISMPNHFLRGVMRLGQEVVMNDVRNAPVLEPRFMPIHAREDLRSSVTTPVYVNARLRAIMLFGSRRLREFSADEVRTMHAISGTVATAIASSDAHESHGNDE